MTDELYPGYDPEIDPLPVTCWGYGTWVEESIARAIRLQREELALWFWEVELFSRDGAQARAEQLFRDAKRNGRINADDND
jgi:hypothetical protein